MAKVFLSHSSEDKEWYVNIVYKKLVKALGGKQLYIYNLNGQKIFTTTFPNTLKEISYIHFTNSIYFNTSTKTSNSN